MKKPSQSILEISNALKILDGKEPEDYLSSYEVKAVARYLDLEFERRMNIK